MLSSSSASMLLLSRVGLRTTTGTARSILGNAAVGTISSNNQHNNHSQQQVRFLNVHEYVSMDIMKEHGVNVPECYVATTPAEAANIFSTVINKPGATTVKDVVMKAQVLSGGRGLGYFENGFQGGVHMIKDSTQASDIASKMIGQKLITKQAPSGIICNKLLLTEKLSLDREMYLSILMDRTTQGPLIVASPKGGTSIEDVAATNPEYIFTQPIDIIDGIQDEQCSRIATNLGFEPKSDSHNQCIILIKNLYTMFIKCDCTQVEVNPLAVTNSGVVMACDAKVNFDDNANYRQKTIFNYRDTSQEDPREVTASEYDLNYIGLDGSIGCMVNGAGLAMSTMDIIGLKGGKPANFLDVGGGANETQVQKAFEILNSDQHVTVILVNIFGGIMKCDTIASGIIKAATTIGMSKPIVVRLQGTNVQQAQDLITNSGHKFILADNLETAASKAAGMANIIQKAKEVNINVSFS